MDHSDADTKQRFAELLLEYPDTDAGHRAAATRLFSRPEQLGLALSIARDWPHDPLVMEFLADLKSTRPIEGAKGPGLPTKDQILREVYQLASDNRRPDNARLAGYRAYAEIAGFMGGKSGNVAIQNNIGIPGQTAAEADQRVFFLPEPMPVEEVAALAEPEQARLVNAARRS